MTIKHYNKEALNRPNWQLGASLFGNEFSPETACPIVNFVKISVN